MWLSVSNDLQLDAQRDLRAVIILKGHGRHYAADPCMFSLVATSGSSQGAVSLINIRRLLDCRKTIKKAYSSVRTAPWSPAVCPAALEEAGTQKTGISARVLERQEGRGSSISSNGAEERNSMDVWSSMNAIKSLSTLT